MSSILRNYLWEEDEQVSAYAELGLLVATFGIDKILEALSELSDELYSRPTLYDKDGNEIKAADKTVSNAELLMRANEKTKDVEGTRVN